MQKTSRKKIVLSFLILSCTLAPTTQVHTWTTENTWTVAKIGTGLALLAGGAFLSNYSWKQYKAHKGYVAELKNLVTDYKTIKNSENPNKTEMLTELEEQMHEVLVRLSFSEDIEADEALKTLKKRRTLFGCATIASVIAALTGGGLTIYEVINLFTKDDTPPPPPGPPGPARNPANQNQINQNPVNQGPVNQNQVDQNQQPRQPRQPRRRRQNQQQQHHGNLRRLAGLPAADARNRRDRFIRVFEQREDTINTFVDNLEAACEEQGLDLDLERIRSHAVRTQLRNILDWATQPENFDQLNQENIDVLVGRVGQALQEEQRHRNLRRHRRQQRRIAQRRAAEEEEQAERERRQRREEERERRRQEDLRQHEQRVRDRNQQRLPRVDYIGIARQRAAGEICDDVVIQFLNELDDDDCIVGNLDRGGQQLRDLQQAYNQQQRDDAPMTANEFMRRLQNRLRIQNIQISPEVLAGRRQWAERLEQNNRDQLADDNAIDAQITAARHFEQQHQQQLQQVPQGQGQVPDVV